MQQTHVNFKSSKAVRGILGAALQIILRKRKKILIPGSRLGSSISIQGSHPHIFLCQDHSFLASFPKLANQSFGFSTSAHNLLYWNSYRGIPPLPTVEFCRTNVESQAFKKTGEHFIAAQGENSNIFPAAPLTINENPQFGIEPETKKNSLI
jgi:hypothetical protein